MTSDQATSAVIDALEGLGLPYMIVGSLSSNAYGIERATKDADFVVDLGPTSLNELTARLGSEFRLDPQATFETVTGATCHRIRLTTIPFLIEIFEPSNDPHAKERFSRRVRVQMEAGRQTWMPTVEDVVVTKLRWSRQAKRNKDRDDVTNVINLNAGELDWEYINRWCEVHGTRQLLDEIRAEIPLI